MNNDLISREALRKDLRRFFPAEVLEGIEPKTLFAQIMHDIDNAPTVAVNCKDCDGYEAGFSAGLKDAEKPQGDIFPMEIVAGKCPIEVGGNCPLKPQGEWIYTDNRWGLGDWECNKCHKYSNKDTNFCPNCGAEMRKGGAE